MMKACSQKIIAMLVALGLLGFLVWNIGRRSFLDDRDIERIISNANAGRAVSSDPYAIKPDSELESSIRVFTEKIRVNPQDGPAFFLRGQLHYSIGDFDGAIRDLTQAESLIPDEVLTSSGQKPVLFGIRGRASVLVRDFNKAISDLTKAIQMNPKDDEAYCFRGFSFGEKGDVEKAINDYTEAIRLNPTSSAAFNSRGNAYRKQRDFNKAVDDYGEAIRLDPGNGEAYYNRGLVLSDTSD